MYYLQAPINIYGNRTICKMLCTEPEKKTMCDLFYPKLVHELNKRVSNKQDIRLFVLAFREKSVVL